jgi:FixJ family two-component response regulator
MIETGNIEPMVYVVDDDDSVRESVSWSLRSVGLNVATFADAESFLAAFDETVPSCVLIDLLMPGMTGTQLFRRILDNEIKSCSIVMISGHGDVSSAVEAMKMGATDFLEKPLSREKLLQTVTKGLNEARQRLADDEQRAAFAAKLQTLTPRERAVFDLVAAGLVTNQIAAQLEISPRTVDVHRSNIHQKLGIEAPSQLAYVISMARSLEKAI